jgi:hypothetical protein
VENFGFSSAISTTFAFSGSLWLGWESEPKKKTKRQKDLKKKKTRVGTWKRLIRHLTTGPLN